MVEILWWGFPAVLIIMAIVQVLKAAGFPNAYAGILSMVLGMAGGAVVARVSGQDPATSIVGGLVAGLIASGAWSSVKNSREGVQPHG